MYRVKEKKELLAESLLELAQSMPVEKITVRAIVENCGVGRQTFYNHFPDKYELINWFYSSNLDRIIEENVKTELWRTVIIKALVFIYNKKKFFGNAISEEGQISFFKSYFEHTKNAYIKHIKNHYGEEELTEDLLFDIQFNCYGAVTMVKNWLLNNMDVSPEILGTRIANAMPESMKKYFWY